FILPSYRENFPSSVLEAMAAGLPVVVTPVGALTELLQDGVNGYFVAPGDDRALARRIVELARDPVLREAMGRANRARVRGAFTPAIVFGQIGDLYAQVLNGDLAGARLSSQEAPHESAS
ncbi:MAG: glycosyltransferase family 4 protein, partial [Anaerolineae bacterium]|nr:glycosyltransferase family 4 protein [Anaerolineae bacterium]